MRRRSAEQKTEARNEMIKTLKSMIAPGIFALIIIGFICVVFNVFFNQILNIFKEESFETYENRFIYTLLINLQYFISKRLKAIEDCVDGNNVTSILFKDNFVIQVEAN